MTNKLSTRFKQFAIGALGATLGASGYAAFTDITFSDFTTGTTISANAMNAKLNLLKDSINEIKFAFKTDQAFYTTPDIPLSTTSVEVVGLDFTCPAEGFVVATSSTNILFAATAQPILQVRNSQTDPNAVEAGFAFELGSGANSTVSSVGRFPCSDGVLVRYSVMARDASGAISSASFSTLVLQFSPL